MEHSDTCRTVSENDALIAALLCGVETCFESYISQYESKIFNTALYLTRDQKQAEEVLYKVFSPLKEMIAKDPHCIVLFDWLLQRALDLSVESLIEQAEQSEKRVESATFDSHKEKFLLSHQYVANKLSAIICSLPTRLRLVFVLHDLVGVSLSRIFGLLCLNIFEVRALYDRREKHFFMV